MTNSQNDDEMEDDARMRAGFGAALALTEEAMTDTTAATQQKGNQWRCGCGRLNNPISGRCAACQKGKP